MTDLKVLDNISLVYAINLDDRILVQSGEVTNLDLSRINIDDLSLLADLKSLQWLYCNGCTKITDLTPLSGLINLKELGLKGCTGISDIKPLQNLKNLEILFLDGCSEITDIQPLESLYKLRKLTLPRGISKNENAFRLQDRGVDIIR